jgi:hypothetical protein
MSLVNTESDIELAIRRRVALKAIEIQKEQRQDLAVRIINSLGKAMSKGKSTRK